MTTNLITNYISSQRQPLPVIKEEPKKAMPVFDIEHELNNKTFIKPLEGRGHLINNNILNYPVSVFKDAIYNAKSLKHTLQGKANDHELGKLNDVSMMTGGLAIAGYLFTRKQTPMTKGMEFVGLASFLASMAIWPKIAIQLPAYLIHGINVQKQYEDSFGRKKFFYQDPQFIPWDLYSDKEIEKIGNRLGVDKNIPDRRSAIQEKMRKIAVQNNTLWMMTAGFATPVMSALICNKTEPYLSKWLNDRQNKKADKIIANIGKYSEKYKKNTIKNELEKIIELYGDKPVNENMINLISDTFTHDMDLVTADSIKGDIRDLMSSKTYIIDENTAKLLTKSLNEHLKGKPLSKEFIQAIVPNEEGMIKLFRDKKLNNTYADAASLKKVDDEILLKIMENAENFNKTLPDDKKVNLTYLRKMITNNKEQNHPIKSVLKKVHAITFNSSLQAKLRDIAKIFDSFNAKTTALDEYALKKVGAAPETVIANYWNNISKDLLKIFGITFEETEKVRFDRNLTGKLLRGKIENIVSDDALYEKVMKELVGKVASLNREQIKPSDLSASILGKNEKTKSAYENLVDTEFDSFADSMRNKGFKRTAKAVAGICPEDNVGTLKNIQKSFAAERVLGVKSSFYRLINTLDYYRRIAKNANNMQSISMYPREAKEEIIELCKIITLQGHSSDYANKFYMPRNPKPANDDSELVVEGGKVINKYCGKAKKPVDIPGDKYFYQRAMQLMFEEQLSPETANILENSIIKDEVMKYRELVLDKIGGEENFAKPNHRIRPVSDAGSELKFLLTGIAPDELVFKAGQQAYNTKKWFKIFGTFGGVLLGVTVFLQFFFGKMPKNQRHVTND